MKRLILIALLLLLPAPLLAASWWRTITVEWGYTPPVEPAVDGFQLYNGTTKVCRFEGADTRAGMCDELIPAGAYSCRLIVFDPTNADGVVWDDLLRLDVVSICTVPAP